ncbi:MAG: Na+ dependent nucleoside transporter domain protein [Phycisphaerales bacterium]|nr:Na+ dependent nucleoside transporter domain protein [Phycisphaerales bacterium]
MILASAPAVASGTLLERGHALLGLVVFLFITHLIGRSYSGAKVIQWRVVSWGIALAFVFGAIVLFTPDVLANVQAAIDHLLAFTLDGAKLVFGNLATYGGAPVTDGSGHNLGMANTGAVVAFIVLPTIIFISMLTAILYRLHVLGWVVNGLAWVMRRTMGTSGAETLSTAANIFVGQTEAPLIIRPFLATATRSELMAIMVGGFANIASGVLVVYTDFLRDYVQNVGGHLAAACFVSAPATLVVSKLILPETETPATADTLKHDVEQIDANLIDAATRGTSEGLTLAINVGAMLLAFTALVSLINFILGGAFNLIHLPGVTLQSVLGYVCAPIAWLCGIPWQDCMKVGSLLGIKTVLNEFVAYQQMSQLYAADNAFLAPRSGLLATYALCGFANIASVGIQIGGISVLAPERRHELSRLGFIAMIGGAIASCIGACVIGVLV